MRRIERLPLLCAYEPCNKPFEVLPSARKRGAKYCSYQCAMLARPRLSLAEKFWARVRVAAPNDCWTWTGGLGGQSGYGSLDAMPERRGTIGAHVASWFLHTGTWPTTGLFVLHSCDQPSCVNPAHLWLGTQTDNMQDCVRKGRQGFLTHPDRFLRGDNHPARRQPERMARGERNGTHTHPERLARGKDHWTHTNPERLARGDKNGLRLHRDRAARGERHGNAKLTDAQWHEALALYATGLWSQRRLAKRYGITRTAIQSRLKHLL
jgi:HNH endonuclease